MGASHADAAPGDLGVTQVASIPDVGNIGELTNVNGTMFFVVLDPGGSTVSLWRSDGTTAGTASIKQFPDGFGDQLDQLTNVNGTLFFIADDGAHGEELWRSNGTAAGTTMVQDIAPGALGSVFGDSADLTNVNGTLFFVAADGNENPDTPSGDGLELWKSGTTGGATMVKNIDTVDDPAGDATILGLTDVNGVLLFGADDGVTVPALEKRRQLRRHHRPS